MTPSLVITTIPLLTPVNQIELCAGFSLDIYCLLKDHMKITNYRWAEMLRGSYLYITHWVRVDKYA